MNSVSDSKHGFAIRCALIASLGGFLFGFETAVISGADKNIQQLWSLSSFWQGFTVSSSLIGTVIGALLASAPAQKFGRKKILIVIALAYLCSAIGCAVSSNWSLFILSRFTGGLAVGMSSVVGPIYISEIAPASIRGRLTSCFQLMIVFGIFVAYLTNFLFVGMGDDAWRWMLGIMVFPALLFLGLLQLIPESPRWLIIKGKQEQARVIFHKLGERQIDHTLKSGEQDETAKESLYQRKYLKPILYAVILAMFNQLSGINAILYYAPRIFELAGFDEQLAYLQPVFIGGANLLFTCLAMTIIDRFGRKKLLLIGSVGMFVFLALVAQAFSQGLTADSSVLVYLIGFIAFFAFSQGAVIWVFIAEIFPNKVRSQGSSLGSATHWIMAAVISWVFPVIAEETPNGGFYSFLFYSIMMALSFFFIWKFMPETKGKSLEDIQKTL
ncbi:sugar porter family MFS transporter [Sphingobacterium sp. SGR-19]|uniref:sugar porter family MFS transporter n=1 Tax=Sphingobacterium sp. SGR-19 TaxID=2710886 RepID=UPI0013EB9D27|nr:sugar porter family MFS transporter [Sphingobacterium sp. SGR-19]NGM65769.1 sugar porter family MFS transporter [Sphingobacterium sp. SGR-19]